MTLAGHSRLAQRMAHQPPNTIRRRPYDFGVTPAQPASASIHRYDTCALISLFCSLVGLSLPALIFGLIGMHNTGRTDERGLVSASVGALLGLIEVLVTAVVLAQVLSSQ